MSGPRRDVRRTRPATPGRGVTYVDPAFDPSRVDPAYFRDEDDDEAASRRLTPVSVSLSLAVVVALALIAFGVFVERGGAQIPILVGGLALMGLALLGLAIAAFVAAVRAARRGGGGRSFFAALFAGVCALGASGCLGSALVFALIWTSVPRA